MFLLVLVLLLMFVAMISIKAAVAVVAFSLVTGWVVKFAARMASAEVGLFESMKAAAFSLFLNALANAWIFPGGEMIQVIGSLIVVAVSVLAFSIVLELKAVAAIVVSLAFWLVAFPLMIFAGSALLRS
ncbi:hypothetical protein QWZ03_20220 [Chitinimonas viridis]|uniref:Phage holin family protein n=1 Tax=Chitinimonas viridis TaxID=664880 RepID=A0ABT8BBD3_9NEIS|nr:hypothetical protein [Chitinimonas viridis]MDN3579100.1 hypothetical protein [Chitinimonas viridis]